MNKIFAFFFLFSFFMATACVNGSKKKLTPDELMQQGGSLFQKYGCAVCHSLNGEIIYGPPLNDFYLKKIKVVRNGKEVNIVADRDYLKKAITEPRFEKVSGYSNKEMPLAYFSEDEAEILVDYIILVNQQKQKTN